MRSAVARNGQVMVRDDVPEPAPAPGQILVQVRACGICGSDLHFVKYGTDMMELMGAMEGLPDIMPARPDLQADIFMGHEFSAEVLELGAGTDGPAPGTLVTSMPLMIDGTAVRDLAYSNELPGGYSERMLLSALMTLPVPNGLDAKRAALTEPMAVGLHAVEKSKITPGEGALVLGAGPIGLAVIASLKAKGIEPIVASDLSGSRRELAGALGAHVLNNPREETAFDTWARESRGKPVVVFEAIGVPGILNDVLRRAPLGSRVLVVGVCMQPDSINPFYGIAKEIQINFALAYTPEEFARSLHSIAEGAIDVSPMITGQVGLDGIPDAFATLASPDRHCKILVVPD